MPRYSRIVIYIFDIQQEWEISNHFLLKQNFIFAMSGLTENAMLAKIKNENINASFQSLIPLRDY